MSRLEEALRRARGHGASPEPFNGPSAKALDWFPSGDPSQEVGARVNAEAVRAETAALRAGTAVPRAEVPAPLAEPAAPSTATAPPAAGGTAVEPLPLETDRAAPRGGLSQRLVIGGDIPANAVEQYRRIAAVLHHQSDRGVKVVMIASGMPGDGKTLTALNLALTLGESYQRRVLLIDADLRRPMVHEAFGLANTTGLSTVLGLDDERPLPVFSVTEHLAVAPTGGHEHDPIKSLTSENMRRIIRNAAALFDWVLIDTPPVALLPDANLLSSMVDAAVLVIGAGQTPLKAIQHAIESLGRQRILGVVLNRVDISQVGPQYGRGYYNYYYSRSPSAAQ